MFDDFTFSPSARLRILRGALSFALMLQVAACGTAEKQKKYTLPGATDYVVESITLKGVETLDANAIKTGLVTREDPGWRADISWMPIVGASRGYYNYIEWERDQQRILTYYNARGYFAARITSKQVVQDDDEKTVRLAITVSEGQPTRVATVQFAGLEETSIDPDTLEKAVPVKKGDRFDQAAYLESKDVLASKLESASYAYAQVRGRVLVDPDQRKAHITYFIDPGPASTFGEVSIEGLDLVDEEHVQIASVIRPGKPYDPALMQETQDSLYDLRVFSLVKVATAYELREFEAFSDTAEEDEGEDESDALGISDIISEAASEAEERLELDPVVPVVIRVKESKHWNLRVGAAAEAEVARQALQARLDWSNPNIWGTFWRIEQFNSVGYAWAPSFLDPFNKGVIADSEFRLTRPQFLERLTTFKSKIQFEREVFEGYNLITPSLRVGVDRPFFKHLHVELSYNFELNELTEVSDSLIDSDVFVDDHILEYLEQRLRLEFRDNILNPTRGWVLELLTQEAFNYLTLGQFTYLKVVLGGQFYLPYQFGLKNVLGFRARLGSLYNLADSEIPVPEKIYSGGVDSMRSFGRRRISYYTGAGDAFPVGANSQLEFSIENRLRLAPNLFEVGDLWGAIFVDAASVHRGQLFFDTTGTHAGTTTLDELASTLLYGVGVGLYWITPIGPIRFDFAYSLSDITDDERFRRCSTGEPICDPSEWVPLSEDPIQDRISGYNFYIGIGHSF